MTTTVGEVMRENARAAGIDLSHVDDAELGVRFVSMPVALTEEERLVSIWMRYGMPEAPVDARGRVRA
jgi:hypothetical protein